MQQKLDTTLGFPFVLIGEFGLCCASQALSQLRDISTLTAGLDAYYLFAPGIDRAAALSRLAEIGVDPSLALFLASDRPCAFGSGSLPGTVENTEEYKNKIFMALRAQRQRHLISILAQARVPSNENFEAAQVAHSFACLLDFSPHRHRALVQKTLELPAPVTSAWPASLSFEECLAHTARLAAAQWRQPAEFRELLRVRSAALPFRARTELRSLAERALESVWRQHAA